MDHFFQIGRPNNPGGLGPAEDEMLEGYSALSSLAKTLPDEGQTATFSVAATGSSPMSYQWQKNGVDIPGATGISYATPPVTIGDSGSIFRCLVGNVAGSAVSNGAVLTVLGKAPEIIHEPVGRNVALGQNATFSVTATGTSQLTYKWQKNGSDIPGATSASFTTPPVTMEDNASVCSCTVTNSFGSVTSSSAKLTVSDIVSDDFDSPVLNTDLWTVVNPRNDATFGITGAGTTNSVLFIKVPAGLSHNAWDVNMAPRVMQAVSNTDFTIQTKFQSTLTADSQMQGIIVERNNRNYLRFDFISSRRPK